MSKRSPHLEPYDGKTLAGFLESDCGAVFIRHTGSHRQYALPDGRVVGTVINGDSLVPCVLARKNAEQLGISYQEFRKRIGHPIAKAGRRKRKVEAEQPHEYSKSEAASAARDLGDMAHRLEAMARQGVRDSSFYAKVGSAAHAAMRCIEGVVE